jgi:hypothetical protein
LARKEVLSRIDEYGEWYLGDNDIIPYGDAVSRYRSKFKKGYLKILDNNRKEIDNNNIEEVIRGIGG